MALGSAGRGSYMGDDGHKNVSTVSRDPECASFSVSWLTFLVANQEAGGVVRDREVRYIGSRGSTFSGVSTAVVLIVLIGGAGSV